MTAQIRQNRKVIAPSGGGLQACLAYMNGQDIPSGADTLLTFLGGFSFNTTPGATAFTFDNATDDEHVMINEDGWYLITLDLIWANNIDGDRRSHIDGWGGISGWGTSSPAQQSFGGDGRVWHSVTELDMLSAGAAVGGTVYQNSGVLLGVDQHQLTIVKIA